MRMLAVLYAALPAVASACTTVAVGKLASSDGSSFLTHSNDGAANPDGRLCWVPARDFALGEHRSIHFNTPTYPRYVGTDRGECYLPNDGQLHTEPIGSIPQVSHTFAYFENNHGMLNEHGLAMAESTCTAVFTALPAGMGGRALLSIDALSRLALERQTRARAAVELMGSLAEKYGYYGDTSIEDSGESLFVGDADEVWLFHILPDPSGASAIWVAQRIPDDEVAVVANMFAIRTVALGDTSRFLYSQSMIAVAQQRGWWRAGEPFDFTRIYSAGEAGSKFSTGRRVWRSFQLVGVDFPDDYDDLRKQSIYPVSARPARSPSLKSLFALHRDHYEGTKYDMTRGLAAGPWGNPDRWTTNSSLKGHWERSIAVTRTTATHVVQVRRAGLGPILWYGPHGADCTIFTPFVARAGHVHRAYSVGNPDHLDRRSAYWAHRYIANVAKIKYSFAIRDIRSAQSRLEDDGIRLVAGLDAISDNLSALELRSALEAHTQKVLDEAWSLPDLIVSRYADGWLDDRTAVGYPDWWLKAVGYVEGPSAKDGPSPMQLSSDRKDGLKVCDDAAVGRCVLACPSASIAICAATCRECRDSTWIIFS